MTARSSTSGARPAERAPGFLRFGRMQRSDGGPSLRQPVTSNALWFVQGLLALIFLFAGGLKLVMPIEDLTEQTALPGLFLRFIAVAEVVGAIGLILPALLRIRPGLTPLAAAGLVIIMIGATVTTLVEASAAAALVPLVVGLLAAFVVYGRWSWLADALRPRHLQ